MTVLESFEAFLTKKLRWFIALCLFFSASRIKFCLSLGLLEVLTVCFKLLEKESEIKKNSGS